MVSLTGLSVVSAGSVNLSGGWDKAWSAVSGAIPGLSGMLSIIGVILLVYAFVTWLWERRRGSGGGGGGGAGGNKLVNYGLIGALCAAPGVIIPLFLKIFDWVANAVVALFAV